MNPLKKKILNCIIVLYLAVIYFAGVPDSNTLNYRIKEKAEVISFAIGIWPSWSMFAPNPIKFDSKSFVEITYKNGDKIKQDVEMKITGILAPFRNARWSKYSQDNLSSPNQRELLAPALRHFRFKYRRSDTSIVQATLTHHWIDVPPFNEEHLPPILEKIEKKTGSEILMAEKD
jgi:hypothetical protein